MKTLKFEYKNYKGETSIREIEPRNLKFDITPNIKEPEWLLEGKDLNKQEDRCFVLKNIQRMVDNSIQRFYCATVYVIDEQKRFLMLHHKKLNKWVPPGGKIDLNETPDAAAVRECFEETGVKVKLFGNKTQVESGLMCPYGVQLNVISPGVREHIDMIYLAIPEEATSLKISEREAYNLDWYSLKDIKKLDTFQSVIQWCEFFATLECH